jgi:5-methylcytosine-specific restriction endonuclease McrA
VTQVRVSPHCVICGAVVSWGATACQRHNHEPAKARRRRDCVECGATFSPPPSAIARSAAKFCSMACYRIAAARRPLFLALTCPVCGTPFRRIRALVSRIKGIPTCSTRCRIALTAGPNGPAYRGGHLTSNRGPGWPKIAASIRDRDGHRCRRCGKTAAENRRALPVDHIIPWRTFEGAAEANRPENLVALCDSCHGRKARAELKWLRGDVLEMWSFQVAVAQPWTKA